MIKPQIILKDNKESRQVQVENYLKSMIHSENWKISEKIPSERDLSIALDVSRTTVRNAILNLTNQGIFVRITGQGTFVCNEILGETFKTASKTMTRNIGYVICKERSVRKPLINEAFYFDVFSGIEESTAKTGRHILFTYLNDFDKDEIKQFNLFLKKVDGVILEEVRNKNFLSKIKTIGIPIVLLAPTLELEDIDLVTADIQAGVQKAIKYLVSLSHTDIAIIDGPLHLETAQIRHKAWEDAMFQLTGRIPKKFIFGGKAWTIDQGYSAMQELLKGDQRPTAVFCVNDLIAIGAMQAVEEAGLSVPNDLSIIGFDDIEMVGISKSPLTTMKIYSRKMGQIAAKRIIEHLEEGPIPPITIKFPIDLVIRKTCKEVKNKNTE